MSHVQLESDSQCLMESRLQKIETTMLQIIKKNDFGVLTRYPNDLKIDLDMIESVCDSSCQIAWNVGDCHTHMVILGIHREDNEMVQCFLNLARYDKFFKITLTGKEDFKISELSRDDFGKLQNVKVPYSKLFSFNDMGFTFCKEDNPIANVQIESVGTYADRKFKVTLRPHGYLSELDKRAAETWARKSISHATGSMFFSGSIVWFN